MKNISTLDINYSNLNYLEYYNSFFFYLKDKNTNGVINILNKNVILKFKVIGSNISIKFNNKIIENVEELNINVTENDILQILIFKNNFNYCHLVLYNIYIYCNDDYLKLLNSVISFNNNTKNNNIISYEEINLINNNDADFYNLFDPNRDNIFIEKDIILQQEDLFINDLNQNKLLDNNIIQSNTDNYIIQNKILDNNIIQSKILDNNIVQNKILDYKPQINKKFVEFISRNILDGIIVNRNQITKLFPDVKIIDKIDGIFIEINGEKIILKEFINKYVKNIDINYFFNNVKVIDKNLINSELIFLIHIGNLHIGKKIINKINSLKNKNDYFFAFNFNNDLEGEKVNKIFAYIKNNFKKFIIIQTNNFGNDILPSLILFNYLHNVELLEFKYVLKIQTKKNKKFFSDNLNILINDEIDDLLSFINNNNQIDSIGAHRYLLKIDKYNSKIIYKNFDNKNMYFLDDYSDIMYLFYLDFNTASSNIEEIKKYIPENFNFTNLVYFDTNLNIEKKYCKIDLIKKYIEYGHKLNININKIYQPYNFFGGTMFLCKKQVFLDIINKNFDIIKSAAINNFYYDNNIFYNNSPIHSIERLFGYGYENIEIMPPHQDFKLLLSYACHINNETDFNLINYHLEMFLSKGLIQKIIFGYSSDLEKNIIDNKLLNDPRIIKNKYNNIGLDMYKHYNNLKSFDTSKFTYTILINDSIIFLKDINYIFSFLKFNYYHDFYSLINSYEKKLHYPSFFWIMNNDIIKIFIKNYSKNIKNIIYSKRNLIDIIEIEFTNKIKDIFKCKSFYSVNNDYVRNIHFDDKFYDFIQKTGYPIIKKTLLYYYLTPSLYKQFENSQLYVTDFFTNNVKNKIVDFKYKDYLKLNPDITDFNKEYCEKHFISNGFFEHRRCALDDYQIKNKKLINNIIDNPNFYFKIKKLL